MITLILDCTLDKLSLGLAKNKELIDKQIYQCDRNQSEIMVPTIVEFLQKNKTKLKSINEIYLTTGPGSFTGVRLGISFAKTCSLLSDINLRCVNTMQAIAGNGSSTIILDAKGGQQFRCEFKEGKQLGEIVLEKSQANFTQVSDIIETMMDIYSKARECSIDDLSPTYVKDSDARMLNV